MDSVKRALARRSVLSLAAIAAGLAPAAFAQQGAASPVQAPPAAPAAQEGVQPFEPSYFRQYNPVTAFDIVTRVPGFEIDDGEALRGFGATAGNVLVNGERPSSKVVISEQLKRIPADSVVRVELISGSASNVDVRGQTQLVNIVLKQAKQGGSPTTWVAEIRDLQYSERVSWNGQLTKTFSLGENAELTVDFQTPNLRGRGEGYETVRNSAGTLTEYREQFGQPNNIGLQGSGVLKWRPTARDTVNINAQIAPTWNSTLNGQVSRSPSGSLVRATFGRSEYTNNYTAEVGADWEHRFSPELSVKMIGLATVQNVDQDDIFRVYNSASVLTNTQTQARTTEAGERVARGFFTWRPGGGHTLDVGVEGAFNFRDATLDIFNNNGSGPVPMALPGSDVRVEETRAEPFITDVWKISPQLTLESGFIFEASTIKKTGDQPREDDFSYAKPRVIATWQATQTDQFRASVIRDIAQLDFAQFASSINFIDANTILGNPLLEPEKTWKLRGEVEHKFGKRGALTLALFHDEVEDVQDFVQILTCVTPNTTVANCLPANLRANDAYGNIGDGTRTGVEVRGSAPLSPLVPDAEIRFSGMFQETTVEDPTTHEDRRFGGELDWTYNVSFRQELPQWKSAWGASVQRLSDKIDYKLVEEVLTERPRERIDLFWETTAVKGVTLRFSAANIFHPDEFRTRTYYSGTRASGIVTRLDERKQKGGPEGTQVFTIRASGTF
jgi:outer membrane cobalamin receptor